MAGTAARLAALQKASEAHFALAMERMTDSELEALVADMAASEGKSVDEMMAQTVHALGYDSWDDIPTDILQQLAFG